MLNRLFFLPALAILLIVAGCTGDSNADPEDDSQGPEAQAPPETQLAETYPVQLSLPGSELISSDETLDQGAVRASAVWEIEAEISDVLDFFENALVTLETQGEPSRLQLGSVGSLTYQGADDGPTYASVEVESTDDGLRTVTVSYLVNAVAASTSDGTESGEPEGETPEPDEPDDPELPANADAASLLLGVEDLPDRPWRVSDSDFIGIDLDTPLFQSTSCASGTESLTQINEGLPLSTQVVSRSFAYEGTEAFAQLSLSQLTFPSSEEAFRFAQDVEAVSSDQVLGRCRAELRATNFEWRTIQRETSVVVASLVTNDGGLVLKIRAIMEGLGGELASDSGGSASNSGGTGSDGGGTDADSGNGAVSRAIPAALIHPDGPGGWTSAPASEGTLYTAGFNVDSQSVEEILDFYQNAFASLGAPTVTTRQVTPFSGELGASGPGGRGTVRIIASSGTRAVQAEFLQFE